MVLCEGHGLKFSQLVLPGRNEGWHIKVQGKWGHEFYFLTSTVQSGRKLQLATKKAQLRKNPC